MRLHSGPRGARLWGLLLVALAAAAAPEARAREVYSDAPLEITADEIEYESARELYSANGNVRVVQGSGRSLDADWVVFSTETRRGLASGGVIWVDGREELQAEFIEFDLDTLEGVMLDGYLDTGGGGMRIWADEMAKTGEDTYDIRHGTFTTCRCEDEEGRKPWEIQAGHADVEVGGYGTATNTTFEVLGIPVLWVPWTFFPVKTERETGFLFPEFGYSSKRGFEVGLPFFWAASDAVNVVFTPSYLTKRGAKPKALVEYVFGEDSWGQVYGTFIDDAEVITEFIDSQTDLREDPFAQERWAVLWESDYHLPLGVRLRADVAAMSDNRYAQDFDDFREYRRDRYLESTAFGMRQFLPDRSLGATVAVEWADDLQLPDNVDRDEFVLQRLPEVSLSWTRTPFELGPTITTGLNLDYTHFWAPEDAGDALGPQLVTAGRFVDTGIDALSDPLERSQPAQLHGGRPADHGSEPGQLLLPDPARSPGQRPLRGGRAGRQPRAQAGAEPAGRVARAAARPLLVLPRARLPGGAVLDRRPGLRRARHVHRSRRAVDPAAAALRKRGRRHDPRARAAARLGGVAAAGPARRAALRAAERLPAAPPAPAPARERRPRSGRPAARPERTVPGLRQPLLRAHGFGRETGHRVQPVGAVRLRRRGQHPDRARRAHPPLGAAGDALRADLRPGRQPDRRGPAGRRRTRSPRWAFFGGTIGGRYRFLREIPAFFEDFRRDTPLFATFDDELKRINQFTARLRLELGQHWALGYQGSYDIVNEELLTNRGYIEFISRCRCWAIQLEVDQDDRTGPELTVRFNVLGLGDNSDGVGRGGLGELSF